MCHIHKKHGFWNFFVVISIIITSLCGIYKLLARVANEYHKQYS